MQNQMQRWKISSSTSLIIALTSLKLHGSHLTCKVANKCLNVHEKVEVVRSNKDGLLPLSCELTVSDERKL